MSEIKQGKKRYWVAYSDCIGCACLQLGSYQHRGAIGAAGSRNTGAETLCCLRNAYHGCPSADERGCSDDLKRQRKKEGMKVL